MVRSALIGTVIVLFGSAVVASAGDKEDVQAAVKKLSDSGFSWKQSTEGGAGGGGGQARGGGAAEGKFQADGLTWVSRTMGDNKIEFVVKGDKGAIKSGDSWASLEDAQNDQNDQAAQRIARQAKNFKLPTVQLSTTIDGVKDFAKADDAFSSDLSEDQVKQLLTFGGRGRGGAAAGGGNATPPQVTNAKGSIKVWLKDGALTKVTYNVQGTMTFNGQDREINRTTTIEFSDVGTTKIDVPAEAKTKAGLT